MSYLEDQLEMFKPYYLDSTGKNVGILEKIDESHVYFHPLVNTRFQTEEDGLIKLCKANYEYNRTTKEPQIQEPNTIISGIIIGAEYSLYNTENEYMGYVIPKQIRRDSNGIDIVAFENHTELSYLVDGDGLVPFFLVQFKEFFKLKNKE